MSGSVEEIVERAHLCVPDDIKVEGGTATVYAGHEVWVHDSYQRTIIISGLELPLGVAATSQITNGGDLPRELMKEYYIHSGPDEITVRQMYARDAFQGLNFILSCHQAHRIMTLPTEHYFGVAFPVEGCDEPEYHLGFKVHEGDQVYYYFPADGEKISEKDLAGNLIFPFHKLNAFERAEVVARVLAGEEANKDLMKTFPEEINASNDETGKYAYHCLRLARFHISNEKQILARARASMDKSNNDDFTEPGPLVLEDIQDLAFLLYLFSVTREETRFLLRSDSQIERFCRDVKGKESDDFLKEKCEQLETNAKKCINNTLGDEDFFPESGCVISLCIWNHYRLIKEMMENIYSRRSAIIECNDKQVILHGGIPTDYKLDKAEEEEEEKLLAHEKTGRGFNLYDPEKAMPGSDPFIDKSDFELYKEAIASGGVLPYICEKQALDEEAQNALEEPLQPPCKTPRLQ